MLTHEHLTHRGQAARRIQKPAAGAWASQLVPKTRQAVAILARVGQVHVQYFGPASAALSTSMTCRCPESANKVGIAIVDEDDIVAQNVANNLERLAKGLPMPSFWRGGQQNATMRKPAAKQSTGLKQPMERSLSSKKSRSYSAEEDEEATWCRKGKCTARF